MSEQISTAILVMIVGMLTVFLILALVVLTGELLIRIVNRYIPVKVSEKPQRQVRQAQLDADNLPIITDSKMAAIVAAVQHLTGGKGRIEKIEKIENK